MYLIGIMLLIHLKGDAYGSNSKSIEQCLKIPNKSKSKICKKNFKHKNVQHWENQAVGGSEGGADSDGTNVNVIRCLKCNLWKDRENF